MKIFITGATGFLGKHLVTQLVQSGHELYIHSRQPDFRLRPLFQGLSNIHFVQGDLTALEIISNENDKTKIIDEIEVVIHAAALYDLSASHSECFLQNVVGTQNIIYFLRSLKSLKAFYYVSTIAVGDPEQFFLEEDVFPKRDKFPDYYSETKYLAELCVREQVNERYVTRIIRPAIIVADTDTGEMPKTDGPYYFIEAYKRFGHLLKNVPFITFPYNPRSKMPIIPVNHCAHLMATLIEKDKRDRVLKTYHLITPDSPTIAEFLQDLNQRFGLKTHYLPIGKNRFNKVLLEKLGIPKEVESFMFSRLSYDKTSTLEDLPELEESSYAQFKQILLK